MSDGSLYAAIVGDVPPYRVPLWVDWGFALGKGPYYVLDMPTETTYHGITMDVKAVETWRLTKSWPYRWRMRPNGRRKQHRMREWRRWVARMDAPFVAARRRAR